ncbi:MAG TPA: ASCH domain-containing protein [Planctomycetaceae bacterium]|nr:ASCH domain-containing protein [Planctomycetaceae bacterium]
MPRRMLPPLDADQEVEVRVLSIRQPFADLILSGRKWCENRTWPTNHTGAMYVHASTWDADARREWKAARRDPAQELPTGGRTGAILGRVQVVGCYGYEQLEAIASGHTPRGLEDLARWLDTPEQAAGWEYVSGPWCWILKSPELLKSPLEMKGKLNLWRHRLHKDHV